MKFNPKLLKELRTNKGLTQEQLAKKAGISPTYVSKIEKGGANPSLPVLETLAKILNVEPTYFFKEASFPTTSQPLPLSQRRIELEEAFQEILQNGEAMFDGLPLKEMDEDIIRDLEIMLAHIIDYLRTKKNIKLQDFPNQGKATKRFLERRNRGELGPHV